MNRCGPLSTERAAVPALASEDDYVARFEFDGGIDPLLRVSLEPGEKIAAESGSMVAMDRSLSLKGKMKGGFFRSLARKVLNDETFFQQWIEAEKEPGEALLAPNLPGDLRVLKVGERQYRLSDGAFLAATEGVEITTKMQSIGRALLAESGGLFIMSTAGEGEVVVSGFGSIRELDVSRDRPILVDNGHLVAWDQALDYELTLNTSRSGLIGKLVQSQLSGEGIVLKFKGEGKVYVCSRSKTGFLDWLSGSNEESKAPKNE